MTPKPVNDIGSVQEALQFQEHSKPQFVQRTE